MTVELDSVPWDQALEQILKINDLGMELEGNILRIAPVGVLRAEAEEEQQLRAGAGAVDPAAHRHPAHQLRQRRPRSPPSCSARAAPASAAA